MGGKREARVRDKRCELFDIRCSFSFIQIVFNTKTTKTPQKTTTNKQRADSSSLPPSLLSEARRQHPRQPLIQLQNLRRLNPNYRSTPRNLSPARERESSSQIASCKLYAQEGARKPELHQKPSIHDPEILWHWPPGVFKITRLIRGASHPPVMSG